MIDIVRKHTFGFLKRPPRQAPPHVRGVLAKLALCRTSALGGRTYACRSCDYQQQVYNSCTDRHCPLCSGAKRGDWLAKTSELLLERIAYFQVVFTLPDKLSSLVLGNRRLLYNLLFQAAWSSLHAQLRKQGFEPAALLVLHTWNQRLEHHPHVHALVPGGGPSLSGDRWISSQHRKHRRRQKPYLTDHVELGRRFRAHFVSGLRRAYRRGELKLAPTSLLHAPAAFSDWLESLPGPGWNVYIEAPPPNSSPDQVLKYLARYMSGGPISDGRLLAHEDDRVTFWARRHGKSRPYALSGVEFVRRWTLHVLPKGYTKSRRYGGYSPQHRECYLSLCRRLLGQVAERLEPFEIAEASQDVGEAAEESHGRCPVCESSLECLANRRRRSWRDLFADYSTCPWWYGGLARDAFSRPPPDD